MRTPKPMQDIVIRPERHRWFVWRDIVTVLLAIAVVMLVRQVGDLRDQLQTGTEVRTKQIQALTEQLEDLQRRLGTAQVQTAVDQARIRQLTDQLLDAGLQPSAAPTVTRTVPGPQPTSPHLTPAPRPSASLSPRPSSRPTPRPTADPKPSPSPSPTCLVRVLGICVP